MPQMKANIDETRYYPTLGLTVNPGDVIEVADDVEIAGFEVVSKSSKKNTVDSVDNKE